MFDKGTLPYQAILEKDFPSFILLIDSLNSVFPILPSSRKDLADGIFQICDERKRHYGSTCPQGYRAYLGCYYSYHLGSQTLKFTVGDFHESSTLPATMFYLTTITILENDRHCLQNVESCNKTFKNMGDYGKAVGQFLWGLYYYHIDRKYDKAAEAFQKAAAFDKTWYYLGEMYLKLSEDPTNDAARFRQQAKYYLIKYLQSANYITFPQIFNMLGGIFEKDGQNIEAVKYYCIGRFCEEPQATNNCNRLEQNAELKPYVRQIGRACEMLRAIPDGMDMLTYENFNIRLDALLKGDPLFNDYFIDKQKSVTNGLAANGMFPAPRNGKKDQSHTTLEKKQGCLVM